MLRFILHCISYANTAFATDKCFTTVLQLIYVQYALSPISKPQETLRQPQTRNVFLLTLIILDII